MEKTFWFTESFSLNLSNPSNVIIGKAQAVATIQDDDAPPTLTINDRTITEGDNGTQSVGTILKLIKIVSVHLLNY